MHHFERKTEQEHLKKGEGGKDPLFPKGIQRHAPSPSYTCSEREGKEQSCQQRRRGDETGSKMDLKTHRPSDVH